MRYWVTTQWPHLTTKPGDAPHNGVWVADEKRAVIAPMAVGDLVWIYESRSGRPVVQKTATGDKRLLKRHAGRGGVVALVEVLGAPAEDQNSAPLTYGDGSKIWWRWHAMTRVVNSAGFIPRERLNNLLGYKPNNPLRGFGTGSSGLMEITEDVHALVLREFRDSTAESDEQKLNNGRLPHHHGPGGEGPIHRALKESVAENPSGILGEEGLALVQMEYPFGATGDRIDVLLRDSLGRYIAVEIEPECPIGHTAGPLQCMKYRSLLAYQFGREVDQVRAFLVTHSFDHDVRAKAERYGIECFAVMKKETHLGRPK